MNAWLNKTSNDGVKTNGNGKSASSASRTGSSKKSSDGAAGKVLIETSAARWTGAVTPAHRKEIHTMESFFLVYLLVIIGLETALILAI